MVCRPFCFCSGSDGELRQGLQRADGSAQHVDATRLLSDLDGRDDQQ